MLISYRPTAASSDVLDEALLARVYDERFRELSDLRVERVVHTLGAEPNRAELVVPVDSYHRWKDGAGVVHEGELHADRAVPPGELSVGIDDVVHVGVPLGGDRVLVIFRGRITDVDVALTEGGESARLTALGPRHAMDNADLRGARCRHRSGSGVVDTDLPLVFNPGNLGNYDPVGSAAEGEPLFGDPAEPDLDAENPFAHHWIISECWHYLVKHSAPAGCLVPHVRIPLLDNADDAVLRETEVEGLLPSQAISLLLRNYGLDWYVDPLVVISRDSACSAQAYPSFRIVSPSAAPLKQMRLQACGVSFLKPETNLKEADLAFDADGAVNNWRIEGDFKEYEACFELQKLWKVQDGGRLDTTPDEGNRAHPDYKLSLDHVYRQWGLNEDGKWTERARFDFEEMFGEGVWTGATRRFHHPYAGRTDEPRKCVLEMKNTDLDNEWHRIASGTVCLLTDRAGIYFDMEDIDGTNARLSIEDGPPQALNEITHLRITAIVKSDERVVYDAEKQDSAGSSQTITRTIQDDAYRRVKRHASSIFAEGETEVVRNDACEHGAMADEALALRRESEPLGSSLLLAIPWIDFTYRVGDRISGISGRGIDLATACGVPSNSPMVEAIHHDFLLQVTALRLRLGTPT